MWHYPPLTSAVAARWQEAVGGRQGAARGLYELLPGTTYEFTVRTVKDSFYSEFSEAIRNTTYETGIRLIIPLN